MLISRTTFLLLVGLAIACSDDTSTPDSGPSDVCELDSECDDGLFCSGVERCDPGSRTADENGCVTGSSPCPGGQACDEATEACEAVDCEQEADHDGDGEPSVACGGNDCDDNDARRAPGNPEICDADDVDEDCDPNTFGDTDADGDGSISAECCNRNGGSMTCGDDCDDGEPNIHPQATEACDGFDNDCDGNTDEMVRIVCYEDADRDGFAALGANTELVCSCPDGRTSTAPEGAEIDCNDLSSTQSPGATELCNAEDDDCDGDIDEELTLVTRFIDADEDGFAGMPVQRCEGDPTSDAASTDCDETRPETFFGAPELCDRLDNNCSDDGGVDPDEDMDNDGHAPTDASCSGGTLPKDDCDDSADTVYTGAPEICDGADNNCDDVTDEAMVTDPLCDATASVGRGVCFQGQCELVSCPPHTEDCDGDSGNGCEASLQDDAEHCGACGQVCLGSCEQGRCSVRVTDISADGASHTCAVLSDGQLACWGSAVHGALGDGALSRLDQPELVEEVSDAATVRVAGNRTMVMLEDGSLIYFGYNHLGESASGVVSQAVTTPIAVMADVQSIDLSNGGGCWVDAGGSPACWGDNDSLELGDAVADHGFQDQCLGGGSNRDCSPTAITVAGLSDIAKVVRGQGFACALQNELAPGSGGAINCWGARTSVGRDPLVSTSEAAIPGLLAPSIGDAISLSAGRRHGCAVTSTGTVQCWGDNQFGQLGTGDTVFSPGPQTIGISDVNSVHLGLDATCALHDDRTMRCWGNNIDGMFGPGAASSVLSPPPAAIFGVRDVDDITVGNRHTCIRRVDGSASCWGTAVSLGDGIGIARAQSAPVRFLNEPAQLELGGGWVCGRRTAGDVWCWGYNVWGYLGNGTDGANELFPQRVEGEANFVEVAAGASTCGLRSNGTVACWGQAGNGELGDGVDQVFRSTPGPVPGIADAVAIDAYRHFCVVHADGDVSCWGRNRNGQANPDNAGVDQLTPHRIDTNTAIDVALLDAGTCALLDTGTTQCWGAAPSRLESTFTSVVSLECGFRHCCAIDLAGNVRCTGENSDHQLGDDSPNGSSVVVPDIADAVQLALGRTHSCARLSSGAVHCWGGNSNGELGRGSTGGMLPPAPAMGVVDAMHITAYSRSTCAMLQSGRSLCWGNNLFGQLGLGNDTTPVNEPNDVVWH